MVIKKFDYPEAASVMDIKNSFRIFYFIDIDYFGEKIVVYARYCSDI